MNLIPDIIVHLQASAFLQHTGEPRFTTLLKVMQQLHLLLKNTKENQELLCKALWKKFDAEFLYFLTNFGEFKLFGCWSSEHFQYCNNH